MMAGSGRTDRGRKGRFWRALAVAAGLIASTPAAVFAATSIDGVTFPATLTVKGRILQLNGMGLRTLTLLQIHAYVGALYLEHPSHNPDAIEAAAETKVLILEYLRTSSKEQVQEVFRRSAARYCEAVDCPQADVQDFDRLVAALPAVKPGDYTTYVFSANGVEVLMNNVPLGTFRNPDFARRVLDSFLGPHAAAPALRDALLGRSGS